MEKFPEKFNLLQPTQNEIGNWESFPFYSQLPYSPPPLIKRTPDTISPTTLGNLHFLSGPTSTWVTKPIHRFHYIPLISTRSSPSLANSAWTTDT